MADNPLLGPSSPLTGGGLAATEVYIREHGLGQLFNAFVVHLLQTRPRRPIATLLAYAKQRFAGVVATGAAVAAVAAAAAAAAPEYRRNSQPRPLGAGGSQAEVDAGPASSPVGRSGGIVVINSPQASPTWNPDGKPETDLSLPAAGILTPGGANLAGNMSARSGRRRRSRVSADGDHPQSGGFDTGTRRAVVSAAEDPLRPPAGLYGDVGATQRRRSMTLMAQPKPGGIGPRVSVVASVRSDGGRPASDAASPGAPSPGEQDAAQWVRRRVDGGAGAAPGESGISGGPSADFSASAAPSSQLAASGDTAPVQDGMVAGMHVVTSFRQRRESAKSGDELFSPDEDDDDPIVSPTSGGANGQRELPARKCQLGGGFSKKLPAAQIDEDEDDGVEAEEEIADCRKAGSDRLDLYDMALHEVPAAAWACTQITSLDLSGNKLTALPADIGALTGLQRLSLKSNQLTELPAEVRSLTQLTHVYLDHNELTALPEGVRDFAELRVVGLDWNDLATFPVELCSCTLLETLYLVENPRVTALPPRSELTRFSKFELQIDNRPELVAQWQGYLAEGPLPARIAWNSVYPDKIEEHLFLGSLRSAQLVRVYEDLCITHVATIGRELVVVLAPGMEQIQINVDDLAGTDLTPMLSESHAFIDAAKALGKGCLVHCFKGQSRSATVVITYLMVKRRITRDAAIAVVKESRPCINPNPGFMDIMLKYEKTLGLS